MTTAKRNRNLWEQQQGVQSSDDNDTFDDIYQRYARPVPIQPLWYFVSNSLVVAQQTTIGVYVLARHYNDWQLSSNTTRRQTVSMIFLWCAILSISYYSSSRSSTTIRSSLSRRRKMLQRLLDAAWLAILLRLFASLLQNLTASYSSDTVQQLAWIGMGMHIVSCDYAYANGKSIDNSNNSNKEDTNTATANSTTATTNLYRPLFHGGTLSLNAALFAVVLLASRLDDRVQAYSLLMLAIVLFAFFPATRHELAQKYSSDKSVAMWIISAFLGLATACLIDNYRYLLLYIGTIVTLLILIPLWKYNDQFSRHVLQGPWDIPKIKQ